MGASLPKAIECTIAVRCCYWQSPVGSGEDVVDFPCDGVETAVNVSATAELEGEESP